MTWQLAQASGLVLKYENAWPWTIVTSDRPTNSATENNPATDQLQRTRRTTSPYARVSSGASYGARKRPSRKVDLADHRDGTRAA
jgi:hypothetical protein